jgi:hypothetical protein
MGGNGGGLEAGHVAGPPASRKFCTFEKGVDLVGHDMSHGSKAANSPEECCKLCINTPKCAGFSLAGNACWLKGEVATRANSHAVRSGVVRIG